jgi:hypothetical protein
VAPVASAIGTPSAYHCVVVFKVCGSQEVSLSVSVWQQGLFRP